MTSGRPKLLTGKTKNYKRGITMANNNMIELMRFRDYLYNTINTERTNPLFSCDVIYTTERGPIVEKTKAMFLTGTLNWGKISIYETHVLFSENYHLDFDPRWQTMKFDTESASLEITGESNKMNGKYNVSIKPTGTATF